MPWEKGVAILANALFYFEAILSYFNDRLASMTHNPIHSNTLYNFILKS